MEMKVDNKDISQYVPITAFVTPACLFIEGEKREKYFVDSQTCFFALSELTENKKYWMIEPHKPKGVKITEENFKEIEPTIKWLVTETSEEADSEKQWSFKEHKPIEK